MCLKMDYFMSEKLAKNLTQLEDILYSESEIESIVDTREHIFELRNEEQTSLGFSTVTSLKTFSLDNELSAKSIEIKNIDSSEWISMFEHPLLQRRRPQLVSLSQLDQDSDLEFYILKHGQKTGPFEKVDLVSLLDAREILLTDMVSYNGGHTWMKLYQVENFDRRTLKKSEQLPGIPRNILERETETYIANNPEAEAISSLAYLSNAKRGKTLNTEKINAYNNENLTQKRSGLAYKWLLIISLIGIGYFLYNIKDQLSSPFKQSEPRIGEQSSQVLTPVEEHLDPPTTNRRKNKIGEQNDNNQINNQNRNSNSNNNLMKARVIKPIRGFQKRKSFMDSAQYSPIQNSNSAPNEEDPNYFYDNTSAMELDPVRSQVSKENFDDAGGGLEGPIPTNDSLFESEVSN
jgi:hypothetical protein